MTQCHNKQAAFELCKKKILVFYSGVATISNRMKDGCSASEEVIVDCPLGIEDEIAPVTFFPNPTDDYVILQTSQLFRKIGSKFCKSHG